MSLSRDNKFPTLTQCSVSVDYIGLLDFHPNPANEAPFSLPTKVVLDRRGLVESRDIRNCPALQFPNL